MKQKQRKGDWVVIGGAPGEIGHCTRCGEGLRINLPQRMEVIIAATSAFAKAHKICAPGNYVERPAQTPEQWAMGRDTGISSLTIWSAITGHASPNRRDDVPHDPDDFGRCYRLLKLFPSWRPQLSKVAGRYPDWAPFVEHWDELSEQYEQELAHGSEPDFKLYHRMKELGG